MTTADKEPESETDLANMEAHQKQKLRPGGPFSFEPMITDSKNLTDSGDSAV